MNHYIKKIIENPLHIFRYSFRASCFLAAVPFVFVIRLVSPIVLIRFHTLHSSRIGHFIMNIEVYLSERDAGLHKNKVRTIDLFFFVTKISKGYVKKLWKRILITHSIFMWIDRANKLIPGNSHKHIVPMRNHAYLDVYGIVNSTEPHLIISEEERKKGKSYLKSKNITTIFTLLFIL